MHTSTITLTQSTQLRYDDVRAVWPKTARPDDTAADFAHNTLVFALSTGVTYESFIKTGLIA